MWLLYIFQVPSDGTYILLRYSRSSIAKFGHLTQAFLSFIKKLEVVKTQNSQKKPKMTLFLNLAAFFDNCLRETGEKDEKNLKTQGENSRKNSKLKVKTPEVSTVRIPGCSGA